MSNKMQLIDKEKLLHKIDNPKFLIVSGSQRAEYIEECIRNAPVIESPNIAEWIPTTSENEVYCSNCKEHMIYNSLIATDKYCRFCGAIMKG